MTSCGSRVSGFELECAGRRVPANGAIPVNAQLAFQRAGLSGAPAATGKSASRECPLSFSLKDAPGGWAIDQHQPNRRMKLAACGRRLQRNAQGRFFFLIAAPAGRSLCAIR